jgi:hypothetical protein
MLKRFVPAFSLLLLTACGAAGVSAPPQTPPSNSPPPAADTTPTSAGQPKPAGLGEAPRGIPDPTSECSAFIGGPKASCSEGEVRTRLASALELAPEARDAELRCLEPASELPAGFVRALRAELAPRGCADVVVGDRAGAAGPARDLADTLVALGVGARLHRSVRNAPLPRPPFDKPAFLKHFKDVLRPWIIEQAHAVDVLSQIGPRLSGYAKGIVALEAGLADMRFVEVARSIELPSEMKDDPEIRETYLVTLEQALEPRVLRGRDAVLVGLGELARQGVLRDARLAEARKLLSEMYAGRRLDALDRLLLPELPAPTLDTPALKLAASLPAFYSLLLDQTPNVDDVKLLRARLERGVPPGLWLSQPPRPSTPELAALQRRALFELGRQYFWAEPFTRAAALEAPSGDAEGALVGALSKVLARGPRSAAALMLGPPTLPPELRDTAGIDALTNQKGPMAGMAEFDAAYVRSLAPPAGDPAFWKEQRRRYERARQQLVDKVAKAAAQALAQAAAATETELKKNPAP